MSADGEQGGVTKDRNSLTDFEQMRDAEAGCVPCKLCGGRAVITDAGTGAGYYIRCQNSVAMRDAKGCMLDQRRLGGWAYNVMDLWNRLHAVAAPATNTQDVVRDALLISRDTMSRAADLVENAYGWTGEANRLRRSADCCRAALAACQAEARGPIHETECWSTRA